MLNRGRVSTGADHRKTNQARDDVGLHVSLTRRPPVITCPTRRKSCRVGSGTGSGVNVHGGERMTPPDFVSAVILVCRHPAVRRYASTNTPNQPQSNEVGRIRLAESCYFAFVPLIGAPHFLHEVVLYGSTQLSVPHFPQRILSLDIIIPK